MTILISVGLSLVAASVVLRYLGIRALQELCAEHWDVLFGPFGGADEDPVMAQPALFPASTPADFDEMILRSTKVLEHLPPPIMKAGSRRVALRNWGRALFWTGVLLIVVAVFGW